MNRSVIFIAGANHSGSTLAGCILGAHPTPFQYFHVGEIHAFFRRTRRHYLFFRRTMKSFGNPKAARNVEGGDIWDIINPNVGYQNAYREIFEKSGAEVIIDSSKKPHHLQTAVNACKRHRWPLHVVITFRPFAKIWESDFKRSNMKLSIIKNIGNYIFIRKIIDNSDCSCTIINIDHLILNPSVMTKDLCKSINMPYFEGKEQYWNYPGCHLYGSRTQRTHMKNPEIAGYDVSKVQRQAYVNHPFLREKKVLKVEQYLLTHALNAPS